MVQTIVAAVIVSAALAMMLDMGASERSQGGRFYVAVGALLVVGFVDRVVSSFAGRGEPFSFGTSEAERARALRSLVILVVAAVVLIGAALRLP
jgi:hypothetical protein